MNRVQWTALPQVDPNAAHGDQAVLKSAGELQKKIDSLAKFRAGFDAAYQDLLNQPPAVNVRDAVMELAGQTHALLVSEAALRGELAEFYRKEAEVYLQAAARVEVERDEAQENLHQDLLKLGYVDGVVPGTGVNCLPPLFYMNHPEIHRLRCLAESLRAMSQEQARAQGNKAALVIVEKQLTESRQRQLAAV